MKKDDISVHEFTTFRTKEELALAEATSCALINFLAANQWQLKKEMKVSTSTGTKTVYEPVSPSEVKNIYSFYSTSLKKNKELNRTLPLKEKKAFNPGYILVATKQLRPGKEQVVKLQPGKNDRLLWVDYTKDYNLGLVAPSPKNWYTLLKAEQAIVIDRWDSIPTESQKILKPLVEKTFGLEGIGQTYKDMQPLRNYLLNNHRVDLVAALDFDSSVRHWYMHKNKIEGVSPKLGGGFSTVSSASEDTLYAKALTLAKQKPDKEVEAWLTLKENVEHRIGLRFLAQAFGDRESLSRFYNSNADVFKKVSKKENEILEGTDTLFRARPTIKALAKEAGFELTQAKQERDVYSRKRSIQGKAVVDKISFTRLYPYIYLNENTGQGGNVEKFIKEFSIKQDETPLLEQMEKVAQAHNAGKPTKADMVKVPTNPNLLLAQQKKLF